MPAPTPDHLVVVCGHAIWLGGPQRGQDESEWLIESYKRGETPTFIEHIKAGLRTLGEDERSALAFSGGPTWKETALSEARSYANLAAANGYFGLISPGIPSSANEAQRHPLSPVPLSSRIILEEQALDSYYNVLFSVVAFWRRFATWPAKLTIVSHAFKRMRIVDAHCAAIGFPLERVDFIGINPPNLPPWLQAVEKLDGPSFSSAEHEVSEEKDEVMRGIREVIGQWTEDPHGAGEALAGKRRARNPWGTSQRLFHSDEEKLKSGVETVILIDGTESLCAVPQPGTAWRR